MVITNRIEDIDDWKYKLYFYEVLENSKRSLWSGEKMLLMGSNISMSAHKVSERTGIQYIQAAALKIDAPNNGCAQTNSIWKLAYIFLNALNLNLSTVETKSGMAGWVSGLCRSSDGSQRTLLGDQRALFVPQDEPTIETTATPSGPNFQNKVAWTMYILVAHLSIKTQRYVT